MHVVQGGPVNPEPDGQEWAGGGEGVVLLPVVAGLVLRRGFDGK